MDAQETGDGSASHFNGHHKVTHAVSREGNGAAPQFTRRNEQQSTEKHKVGRCPTDPTIYRDIGECTDSVWTGSGPHHLNWLQQVQINMSGTDNGAVYNFTRTDSTKEPEKPPRKTTGPSCSSLRSHKR